MYNDENAMSSVIAESLNEIDTFGQKADHYYSISSNEVHLQIGSILPIILELVTFKNNFNIVWTAGVILRTLVSSFVS